MSWQKSMCTDVTALYAPSMAQTGLSVGIRADGLLVMGRTLRRSNILRSHKSEYKFFNLPMQALKIFFSPKHILGIILSQIRMNGNKICFPY